MSNTFGEELEDILPHKQESAIITPPAYPIKRQYGVVAKELDLRIESTFKVNLKWGGANNFFNDSRFIVWRSRSVNPNKYYWERKSTYEDYGVCKFGPFNELNDVLEDIKDLYGFKQSDVERLT